MARLKKSLALLLAIVMMFSSMSVAASATYGKDGVDNNDIRFQVVFFRELDEAVWVASDKGSSTITTEDGTVERGDWVTWVPTNRAAPNEEVKARLYMETSFPTATGQLGFAFNEHYFTQLHASGDRQSDITIPTNSAYPTSAGSFNLASSAVWYKDATLYWQNLNNKAINYLVNVENNEDFTIDYFDNYDIFSASLNFGYGVGAAPFTVSRNSDGELTDAQYDWVAQYSLKVNSNETTTSTDEENVNKGGDALVPALYNTASRLENDSTDDDELFVDFSKYTLGSTNRGSGDAMYLWEAEFETIPASLTTITNLTFNANGGAWVEDGAQTKGPLAAIIGQPLSAPEGTLRREGYAFKGWTTEPVEIPSEFYERDSIVVPDDITDADEIEAYIDEAIDAKVKQYIAEKAVELAPPETNPYEDATYYALWEPTGDITFTINTYEMDVNGNYILKDSDSSDALNLIGQTIERQDGFVPDGFYIDEDKSDKSVTISNDSSSNVLDVYYARKNYTVAYHYEDGQGVQEETYEFRKVIDENGLEKKTHYYYGAAFPQFLADINGTIPAPTGYHFVGWSRTPVANGDEENATLVNLPTTIDTLVDSEVDPENRVYDLYAVYAENTYTYTFYAYAEEDATRTGSFSDSKQIITYQFEYGESTDAAKQTEEPGRVGYTFEGWDIDIPATASGDLDFYPIYNQGEHVVEFWAIQDDSGEYTKLDETYIGYGDSLLAQHLPENYPAVNSWALADDTIVNFPYTVTEDTVLYLVEGKNVYPVDFYVDGVLYESIPTIFDSEVKAPAVEPSIENGAIKPGYEFVMWNGFSEGMIMDSTDGMRFDAITEKKDITLTFVVDGEETKVTGKFDTTVPAEEIPEIPAKEGYEEGNWNPEAPVNFPAEDTTYTAKWTPKKITLTFIDVVDGNESTLGTMTGDAETAVEEPREDPEKNGYTFKGWKVENSETDVIATAPVTYPTKDTKYYASWEINKYNYNISLNGGNVDGATDNITATDVPFGTEVMLPAPKQEGNTFLGWAMADDTSETIIIAKDATSFTLEKDTSLKAVWSKDEYSVTFKSGADDAWVIDDKGVKHSSITIDVKYGDAITAPAVTRGEKYTFNGWNEDSLNIEVPEQMPAKDLVFTAQWKKIPQNVEYEIYAVKEIPGTDGEYADPVLVGTYTGTEGEKVEVYFGAPDAEFAAENTHDWSTLIKDDSQVPDPDNANNSETIDALVDGQKGIITVYYKLASFDITFNAGADAAWEDGDPSKTVSDQKYGYVIDTPDEEPEKTGYVFGGWEDANKDKLTDTTTVTGAAEYTAIWTPEQHVAHFIVVDGENKPIADIAEITKTYNYEDTITAPEFTLPEKYQKGYTFTTWEISPDTMGTQDIYYYATLVPVDYSVTYVVNGATVTIAPQKANVGDEVKVAKAPELEGYTFSGWTDKENNKSYSADGNGILVMPADDVVLTGTYTGIGYTINIDSNGIGSDKRAEAVCGSTVEALPEPDAADIPADTKFEGIFDENGNKVTLPFEMTAGDKNYSYGWSYKVAYEYAGVVPADAAELPAEAYVMPGAPVEIAAEPAAVEGYTFLGWTIDGKDANDFTMGNKPVKIIGEWKVNDPAEATISYAYTNTKPDGADNAYKSETASVGDTISVKALPETEGYVFDGWYVGDTKYAGGKEIIVTGDIAFTGTWRELYDITYNNEDGTVYETITDAGVAGSAVPAPTKGNPSKDGYTFEGWVDSATGNPVTSIPEGNVTLKPVFAPVIPGEYTVSYKYVGAVLPENADDTLPADHKVEAGKTAVVAAVPEISGYTFSGWYYNGEIKTSFTMPYADVVLTGTWTKDAPKYTLTLDPNDGTLNGKADVFTEKYEAGTDIPPVATPVREGYRFEGWVGNSGIQDVPETMPANDVKLTARWTQIFDVTYVNEDGSVYEEFKAAGAAGEKLPAPKYNPTKDGYIFTKWVDAETGADVTAIPEGGVTLKPVFEEIVPDSSTITYEFTGDVPAGVKLPEAVQAAEGTEFTVAKIENVDGYEFKGWTLDGEPKSSFIVPENDVTLKGEWVVLKYDILLDANGGAFSGGTSHFPENDVPFGTDLSDIIPAAPERTGYKFIGWVDADGNNYEIPSTMPNKDINVKAKWEIKSYTITFDSKGGNAVDEVVLEYQAAIDNDKLPVPVRDGFIFTGWTDADGNALPANMPAEDITAYASWKPEESTVTYELTVNAGENGKYFNDKGEEVDSYLEDLKEGDVIADFLKIPVADEGYEFKGWSGIPADGKMPAAPLTVTAIWDKVVNKHNVNYYLAKGDSKPVYEMEFAEGEAIVNPEDPSLEGFTFVGWVDENGNAIPEVMGTEDIVAYAKFEVNYYQLTYIVDGEVIYYDEAVPYASEVYVPDDPTPADPTMIFAGWNPTVETTMPAKDMTYVAVFAPVEEETYVAKFISDGKTVGIDYAKEGEAIDLPDEPTKFGYKFVGWEPEVPDAMPAHDMTFEAQWEVDKTFIAIAVGGTVIAGGAIAGAIIGGNIAAITGISIVGGILVIVGVAELAKHTHTVTYIVDGEVYKTYKVVEGTKVPVPADPSKEGFKFEGWNPDVPEKMGNTDLVFEAEWSAVDGSDDADADVNIPDTGSVAGGLAAFAVISGAAAAAYVFTRKKKED